MSELFTELPIGKFFENMVKMPLFICFLGYNKVYGEKGFSANNKF